VAQLPLIKNPDDINVVLPKWKSQLDPILATRLVTGRQVMGVVLSTTATVIYHKLDRLPIGWVLSDQNASAVVYRTAPMTPTTITLAASAPCSVSLWVY
jgi:hypothetical protein